MVFRLIDSRIRSTSEVNRTRQRSRQKDERSPATSPHALAYVESQFANPSTSTAIDLLIPDGTSAFAVAPISGGLGRPTPATATADGGLRAKTLL